MKVESNNLMCLHLVPTYELGVRPLLQAMEIYGVTDLVKHRAIEEF